MENLTKAALVRVQRIDGIAVVVEETKRDVFEKIERCIFLDRYPIKEHSQIFCMDGSGGVQFELILKNREDASKLTVGKYAELAYVPKDGQSGTFLGVADVPVR